MDVWLLAVYGTFDKSRARRWVFQNRVVLEGGEKL
jgi:hypothetical protein